MSDDAAMPDGRTLDDPLAEARRLVALADAAGLQLRLMGGLAFHARVPTWQAPIERPRRDIDLATRHADRKAVAELLAQAGYEPDRQYNVLHGHKQLYFMDLRIGRPVDVLVDRLEMCHRFEFGDRLHVDHPTLPLAELLLSKLQIVKINRKDLLDVVVLLRRYDLADTDTDAISLPRITALTSSDWGWWRTVTGNIDRLADFVANELGPDEVEIGEGPGHDMAAQLGKLRAAIDAAPKSLSWRVRSRVGDRMAWYDEPEEVGHDAE